MIWHVIAVNLLYDNAEEDKEDRVMIPTSGKDKKIYGTSVEDEEIK